MSALENTCALVVSNPNKLNMSEKEISMFISTAVSNTIREGLNTFVIALNSDIQIRAAEIIIQFRENYRDEIKLGVIESIEGTFPKKVDAKKRYKKIIREADKIMIIPVHCGKRSNDKCNEWLMNHVDYIIPIFTGEKDSYIQMVSKVLDMGKGICYSEPIYRS